MIKTRKFVEMFQEAMNGGSGVWGYQNMFRNMLGITENKATGDACMGDTEHRALDINEIKQISIQDLAISFMGADYKDKMRDFTQMRALQEAGGVGGTVVLPSWGSAISGFSATAFGLVDALIIEAYSKHYVEFIGDEFCETRPTSVNGGYAIGWNNDAGAETSQNLLAGQPVPMVGMKPTKITRPENQRRGQAIAINETDIWYDLTGEIQDRAENHGYTIRRNKEIAIADQVLGITNNFTQDGVSPRTYQVAASSAPCDYINMWTNSLNTYQDIQAAHYVLNSNTDPFTGFELALQQPLILISPAKFMDIETILAASAIRLASASDLTNIRYSDNPLSLSVMRSTMRYSKVWHNRLTAHGFTEADAQKCWYYGDFKRAFRYLQLQPFRSRSLPLSSEDYRRGTVLVMMADEYGVPMTYNPRFVGRMTDGTDANFTLTS